MHHRSTGSDSLLKTSLHIRRLGVSTIGIALRGHEGFRLHSWNRLRRYPYNMSSKIFLTPVLTFATLDDDMYGARSKDYQSKSLLAERKIVKDIPLTL